ncbi:unnamed protein product [Tuber aestivum]|uniref:Fungal lipase-type domain-containing protein n=1 Tax=Tuber aestivum TaxID=59557 RepID=A0A292PSM7_9PEZI|nr:unnamed protein product [Tuber aestivum]
MISIFLRALLTACPLLTLSAPVYQIPLGQSSVGEISNELFEQLEGLAEIVQLYSDDSARLRRDALLKNLDVVHQWDDVDIRGYVAVDNRCGGIYLVFDGEYGHADALVDLANPLPFEAAGVYGSGGLVHDRIQKGWEAVGGAALDRASRLRSNYGQPWARADGMNIVGRGVGGSVASLAALNFAMQGWEPRLTTFGQPRFGDAEFMKFFDEEEYFIHKPFPPYLPSDIRVCALESEDPICSARARTSPFDLPFTQSPYLATKPAAPIDMDTFLDLPSQFAELDIEFFPLAQDLDFGFSLDLKPFQAAPPSSSLLSLLNPSPPNPNLNRRSIDRALEYFHLPKHQLEASLADAEAVTAYEASLAQDPNDPNHVSHDCENLENGEDLVSQASSIIIYNGRPVEVDGRPALSPRDLLSGKGRIGRCRRDGPGVGLTLENTTPAHTASEPRVEEEMVDVGGNSIEGEAVNVQKGQNFRVYNDIPVRKDVDARCTGGAGGGVEGPPFVKVEGEKVEVVGAQDEAKGLPERRLTYGWGKWEPYMHYLEGLDGPAIMSVAYEDDLDSGIWAGEAPDGITKDRFWGDMGI